MEGPKPPPTVASLLIAFNNVMIRSQLAGRIDLQKAAAAFSTILQERAPDQPLALSKIYDVLLQMKAPEVHVREVLFFLKSREDKLGLTMELPAKLQALSAEEQQRTLQGFGQRAATPGTNPGGSGAVPVGGSGAVPVAPGAPPLDGTPTGVWLFAGAPTTSPGGPAPAAPFVAGPASGVGLDPTLRPGGGEGSAPPPRRRTAVTNPMIAVPERSRRASTSMIGRRGWMALALTGMVALLMVQVGPTLLQSGAIVRTPIVVDVAGGLPCVKAETSGRSMICYVTQAFATANKQPEVDKIGNATLKAAQARGLTTLIVYSVEDGKLQWMFSDEKHGLFGAPRRG